MKRQSAVFCGILLALCVSAEAADVRIVPEGQVPADTRLEPLKDLNGYFPMEVPQTKEAWQARAEKLRRRVLVANGLWPMPTKTPAKAVLHSKIDRGDYTVEKVYFESFPGHYVTGLLYRPKGKPGKHPAVLSPHGHGGRLQDHGPTKIKQLITEGREQFESGRYPKRARCVGLARMGCVVFIWDMLGYADSQQISRQLAHGFAKQRPEFESPESWGFYSTQAELRMQSIMGVQTYNAVRALDWISSLPDVDPSRIGVTGGSGGGTQTILLGAIDPRPIVSFPNGMVSTAMQGGCTCENTSCLRIGTGNIELTALFAPRPVGMTGANDWTKDIMTKGYPELQKLYGMLGVKENVLAKPLLHFPHNYNYVSRAIMYAWFNKHLKLGLPESVVEADFEPLTGSDLTVWDDAHPKPKGGPVYERSLIRWMDEDSNKQMAALAPENSQQLGAYRRVVGGAFETLIGRTLAEVGPIEREKVVKEDRGDYWVFGDLLRTTAHKEELPVVFLHPKNTEWNGEVVVWLTGRGKRGLFADDGSPRNEIRRLLDAGTSVMSADLLYQGESLKDGKPLALAPKVANPREAACYTHGYNHSLFARRVHDVLTLVSFLRNDEHQPKKVHLVGVEGAGVIAAAALTQLKGAVDKAAVNTEGFRFASLKSIRDPRFLPGVTKYGDVPGLLGLAEAKELLVAGEGGKLPALTAAVVNAAQRGDHVTADGSANAANSAVEWLLK